ncbi:hypothetical protein D3C72_2354050 [compost metagenome]
MRTHPFSWQSICQGTMLAWCSMTETRISSPSLMKRRPNPCMTRLMASVAPRTKTISRSSLALMKRWALTRTSSYAAEACSLRVWTPR